MKLLAVRTFRQFLFKSEIWLCVPSLTDPLYTGAMAQNSEKDVRMTEIHNKETIYIIATVWLLYSGIMKAHWQNSLL